MATQQFVNALLDSLRGQSLTIDQADDIREALLPCTASQPRPANVIATIPAHLSVALGDGQPAEIATFDVHLAAKPGAPSIADIEVSKASMSRALRDLAHEVLRPT